MPGLGIGIGTDFRRFAATTVSVSKLVELSTLDFTNNQWTDASGNGNHFSLVESNSLASNGTSAKVAFNFPTVSTFTDIKIWAKPSGGSWAIYTSSNAPTGLYHISGSLLELGYNGSVYWAGSIARVQGLVNGSVVWDKPLQQGAGTSILLGMTEDAARRDDVLYTLSNQTPYTISKAAGTSYTQTYKNDNANGWTVPYVRIEITAVDGGNQSFGFYRNSPSGAVTPNVPSYVKCKIRSNRSTLRPTRLQCYDAGGAVYEFYPGSSITTVNQSVVANNMSRFYCSAVAQIAVGDFWEIAESEYGQRGNDAGTITNATWAADCSINHGNLELGHDLWRKDADGSLLYATCKANGDSILTTGGTLAGYTWIKKVAAATTWHNGAETKIKAPDVQALKDADTLGYLFTTGTANAISFDSLVSNKGDYFFSNSYNLYLARRKDTISIYASVLTGSQLKTVTDACFNAATAKYEVLYSANHWYVRSRMNANYDVVHVHFISASGNFDSDSINRLEVYKPLITTWDTVDQISSVTDEIGPLSAQNGTYGGNHTFEVYSVVMAGHDKTSQDIGSRWRCTNNGMTNAPYTLYNIVGNTLYYIGRAYTAYGYNYYPPSIGTTLVHVSGAVHRTTVVGTSQGSAAAYPCFSPNISMYVDNVVASPTISTLAKSVYFDVDYTVKDPFTVADNLAGGVDFRVGDDWFKVTYRWTHQVGGTVRSMLTHFYKSAFVQHYYMHQIVKILYNATYHTKSERYIPGTKAVTFPTIGTKNYSTIVDNTTPESEQYKFAEADLIDSNFPVNRQVQYQGRAGSRAYGRADGINILRGNGIPATMKDIADKFFFINGTNSAKSAFSPINFDLQTESGNTGKTIPSGTEYDLQFYSLAFDASTRSDGATHVYYHVDPIDNSMLLYIDFHTSVTGRDVIIPPEIEGTLSVVYLSPHMTINSSSIVNNMINVTTVVTGGVGEYAILKLS